MAADVNCTKLNKLCPGLEKPPIPGALGERIFNTISQEAWAGWINHQTMLMNEYRLSTLDPNARKYLTEEMEKYLFGEGSDKPAGFVETSA